MATRLTDNIYDLDMGLALAIDRAHHKTIRCVEARLWITQEGLAEDFILAPGECFKPRGTGRVVIAALVSNARFAISTQPGWTRRFADTVRGFWRRLFAKELHGDSRSSCIPAMPCQKLE